MLSVVGNIDPAEPMTELRLPDGRVLRLPTAMLQEEGAMEPSSEQDSSTGEDVVIIPIVEEQLDVSKRVVPTAQVRLRKGVDTYDVELNEPLAISTYRIERVLIGQVVQVAPAVRQEANSTIYPIVEERLVLTKELVLVEEVRVTNELSERRDTQVVSLRRERLEVSRKDVMGT